MNKLLVSRAMALGLATLLVAAPLSAASVNQSIKVADGGDSSGETSVNGSITVGDDATVSGTLRTVNGRIRVGDNSTIEKAVTVNGNVSVGTGVTAERLETVNGSVEMGAGSSTSGGLEAVNGAIIVSSGGKVGENISNVNGDISVSGATVGGDISTVSGNVELSDGAIVSGDLVVKKPSMWGFGNHEERVPEIVIGPGCRVDGLINLEREVKLFISESAAVGGVQGAMSLEDAVRFSGEHP